MSYQLVVLLRPEITPFMERFALNTIEYSPYPSACVISMSSNITMSSEDSSCTMHKQVTIDVSDNSSTSDDIEIFSYDACDDKKVILNLFVATVLFLCTQKV